MGRETVPTKLFIIVWCVVYGDGRGDPAPTNSVTYNLKAGGPLFQQHRYILHEIVLLGLPHFHICSE